MKIGSHVGMSGKEMMLSSAKETVSYGSNTFETAEQFNKSKMTVSKKENDKETLWKI